MGDAVLKERKRKKEKLRKQQKAPYIN